MKYLEFKDSTSSKFWEIKISGKSFTVTFGKIGTAGQSQTKQFDTEEKCRKEAEKLINEKLKKGYVEKKKSVGGKTKKTAVKKTIMKNPQAKKTAVNDLSKSTFYTSQKIEKQYDVKLPKRLKSFIDSGEYLKYNGMYCANLPSYTPESKFKVKFDDKYLFELLEDNDIAMPDDNDNFYIPLSVLDGSQFAAVNISKGDVCPVAMWEHENGLFYEISESLDVFLKSLLKKGEKTPYERMQKSLDEGYNLLTKNKYDKLLDLLNGIEKEILSIKQKNNFTGIFYQYRGLCYKGLKDYDKAISDLELSNKNGSSRALLSLINIYIYQKPDYKKALAIADSIKSYDSYTNYHKLNYTGYLYILLGDKDNADKTYRKILESYEMEDPENIDYSIKDLQEIIDDKKSNANLAVEILTWFNHKTYDLTPEVIEANRNWWNSLDNYGSFWKETLKKEIKIENEPSDNDIAKMLCIESLRFNERELIHDATPFKMFKNLKKVFIYGDLESLEIFKNMNLKRLTYNGNINKNFKLPSVLNINLIKAAEEGNIELVKELLGKGADINARIDGYSALFKAITTHNDDLAIYLVENGADPYLSVGSSDNMFVYCGPEMKEKIQKVIIEKGIKRYESPFRVITKNYKLKNVYQLGYLNVDVGIELAKGISMTNDFPENAAYKLRNDYPGYKKDINPADCFFTDDDLLVVNEKVKTFFIDKKIPNIEIFPVKILDHSGKEIKEKYFIINPLAHECLDIEASMPEYNHIDESINHVISFVITESLVPKDLLIFRVKEYPRDIIVRKEFAIAMEEAGFTGIIFKEPKR